METKISKAQLFVWEWKEKAYEEVKHLSIMDQIRIIHEKTIDTIEEIKEAKRYRQQKP